MAARIAELRDAVGAFLDSQVYSFTFKVITANWATSDLADTNFTNVYVYPAQPAGNMTEAGTRDTYLRRYFINVHLVNYLDTESLAEEDAALQLMEELELSLEHRDMAGFDLVGFTTSLRPFFELESAQDRNTFHAITTLEYLGTL